LSRRL